MESLESVFLKVLQDSKDDTDLMTSNKLAVLARQHFTINTKEETAIKISDYVRNQMTVTFIELENINEVLEEVSLLFKSEREEVKVHLSRIKKANDKTLEFLKNGN